MRENTPFPGASPRRTLYPAREPFDQRKLAVPGGHTLYVEQSGNPKGQPVVVFHGGPGGGCSPVMRRFFDPQKYRVILFDQRGCGRSTPHASVENNTTWDLVRDIELIRETLGIESWAVFGGSWGATLALVYAQAHPDRVTALILRGVFLMMQRELDWFYQGGAAQFFPEEWARLVALLPKAERGDIIAAFGKRLFGQPPEVAQKFARAWVAWEANLAAMETPRRFDGGHGAYAMAFARIENHYFTHGGWLEEGQILRDMHKIAHIPGEIVQGRYDMVCPPYSAFALHRNWPASNLHMVPDAGHAMTEPGILSALVAAMDRL